MLRCVCLALGLRQFTYNSSPLLLIVLKAYRVRNCDSCSAALTTSPEDILATSISSVDADLSHIPSVHDSMNLERTGLPDFVLNTNDSRYLDYTQTHSSEDLYITQPALMTHSLNLPLWFSQSSEDIHSSRLGYATHTGFASLRQPRLG